MKEGDDTHEKWGGGIKKTAAGPLQSERSHSIDGKLFCKEGQNAGVTKEPTRKGDVGLELKSQDGFQASGMGCPLEGAKGDSKNIQGGGTMAKRGEPWGIAGIIGQSIEKKKKHNNGSRKSKRMTACIVNSED